MCAMSETVLAVREALLEMRCCMAMVECVLSIRGRRQVLMVWRRNVMRCMMPQAESTPVVIVVVGRG